MIITSQKKCNLGRVKNYLGNWDISWTKLNV